MSERVFWLGVIGVLVAFIAVFAVVFPLLVAQSSEKIDLIAGSPVMFPSSNLLGLLVVAVITLLVVIYVAYKPEEKEAG